jgi:hypothetical protein
LTTYRHYIIQGDIFFQTLGFLPAEIYELSYQQYNERVNEYLLLINDHVKMYAGLCMQYLFGKTDAKTNYDPANAFNNSKKELSVYYLFRH